MGVKTFQIVYQGQTIPGASREKVKANLAKLFKAPAAKIEPLFSGKPVVIKKNLDEATARKYLIAFKRAGAVARVVNTARARPRPEGSAGGGSAPTAATQKSAGALAGVTVDQPGVVIVEPQRSEPPAIDTAHLSMDRPGATLAEPEPVAPPQVNTEGMSLDEPGVKLVEQADAPPLEVDTSGLSMDEPGATLVEPEPVEAPAIDTSSLALKQ